MRPLRSTAVYGRVDADNLNAPAVDALNRTRYISANLVWSPYEDVDLGVEYLWGKLRSKDGAGGTHNRVQLTSELTF